ncbi:MAG: 6-phosphofructokinase [Deferribacterota bacterium]|nr:6-phosphofructokinase [Deferribacterota bacterium]
MEKLALLTSGGDAPGMNACIRSTVRTAISKGVKVYGVYRGYEGLINGELVELESRDVANIIQKGGTILKSARSESFRMPEGRKRAFNQLEKFGIDGIIVIGGDGSLTGAYKLYTEFEFPVVGVPGSIDNDIYGTDLSIGVDSALNRIINAIDIINDTASSHDRTFVIEVMGRNNGFLALMSTIAGGAEYAFVPEKKCNYDDVIKLAKDRYKYGKSRSIIIVAEGAAQGQDVANALVDAGFSDTRVTVLGHLQRGGPPTYFDRILGTSMGIYAVEGIINGKAGTMVALKGSKLCYIPLKDIINKKKSISLELLEINKLMNI